MIPRWLVHPHAQKKVMWDLMMAVLIVYSTLSVPFRIGFDQTAGLFGTIVDTVVDVAFTLDIVASFRTAFVDEVSLHVVFGVVCCANQQEISCQLCCHANTCTCFGSHMHNKQDGLQ